VLSQDGREGEIFLRITAALPPLINMRPLLAWSISRGSTFSGFFFYLNGTKWFNLHLDACLTSSARRTSVTDASASFGEARLPLVCGGAANRCLCLSKISPTRSVLEAMAASVSSREGRRTRAWGRLVAPLWWICVTSLRTRPRKGPKIVSQQGTVLRIYLLYNFVVFYNYPDDLG
jgi:hypothetical protein